MPGPRRLSDSPKATRCLRTDLASGNQQLLTPGLGLPWPGFILPVFPPLPLVLQESEGGLYICMNTFLGFGKQYVERHFNKTGQRVYLHLRRTRRPVGEA